MAKHTVLCVDDESDNVDALERLFRKKYRVLKATTGEQGLEILANEKVSLIISDQRMPSMTGVEFLRRSMRTHPYAVRILLTGYTDITSVIAAINSGEVYRYITKPWDPVDLANTVDKGIEKFELAQELKEKNQALSVALEELRTLDQAKTSFMVLVNHELKTPLTSLLSFAALLRESEVSSEQTKYVTRIESSAFRLKEIVDDVLQLISAEAGILPVNLRKIQARDLFREPSSELQQEMAKRHLKFEMELSRDKVFADPKIVANVFERILHNAVKFSRDDSTIKVYVKNNDSRAIVVVENSGKELSQKAIARILKPFTLNEDMMNHSQGLGLGLNLCQALLKRVESELQISSHDGKVQVSFALPLA